MILRRRLARLVAACVALAVLALAAAIGHATIGVGPAAFAVMALALLPLLVLGVVALLLVMALMLAVVRLRLGILRHGRRGDRQRQRSPEAAIDLQEHPTARLEVIDEFDHRHADSSVVFGLKLRRRDGELVCRIG